MARLFKTENNTLLSAVLIVVYGILSSLFFNTILSVPGLFGLVYIAVSIAVILILFNPEAVFTAAVFLIPFNLYLFDVAGQYTFSFLHLLLIAVLLQQVHRLIAAPHLFKKINRALLLSSALFFLCVLIAVIRSGGAIGAVKFAGRLLVPLIFCGAMITIQKKYIRLIVRSIAVSGVLLFTMALGQWIWGLHLGQRSYPTIMNEFKKERSVFYFFIDHDRLKDERVNWFVSDGGFRAFGTFANSNNLAGYAGLVAFLLFPASPNIRKSTLYGVIFTVITGFLIMITGSKTGMAAFILSAVIFFSVIHGRSLRHLIAVVSGMAGILLLSYMRFMGVRGFMDSGFGIRWRFDAWAKALDFIVSNPSGISYGTYPHNVPHNILLFTGIYMGILGMLFFIWMILAVFFDGIKTYGQLRRLDDSYDKGLIVSILCGFAWFIIHAMSDNIFIGDSVGMLFWTEVGILSLMGAAGDKVAEGSS